MKFVSPKLQADVYYSFVDFILSENSNRFQLFDKIFNIIDVFNTHIKNTNEGRVQTILGTCE